MRSDRINWRLTNNNDDILELIYVTYRYQCGTKHIKTIHQISGFSVCIRLGFLLPGSVVFMGGMTLAGRDLQGLSRRFGGLWVGALAEKLSNSKLVSSLTYMGMDQYLLIPFLVGMNIHLPAILM